MKNFDVSDAGRVAEEIIFGDLSTGAQNDLQQVTDMARYMVAQYAMSDTLGLAAFEQSSAPFLYRLPVGEKKVYSEHTAQAIDTEIIKLFDQVHARVQETLNIKRELLDTLAQALLEKETIDRAGLDALLHARGAQAIRQMRN